MGYQRLAPIHSVHEDDPEFSEGIDAFVVGLGEWIDTLQDAHAAGDFETVVARAAAQALAATTLGYPGLSDAARQVVRAAEDGEDENSRKAIGDLIELVQRVRLGHRSAA